MNDSGNIQRQVGWFVISGIAAFTLLLLLLSLRTDLFAKKFHLYVSPPSAAAFHVGQAVKFQGFSIGQVHDVELTEAGKVRVDLRLRERYRHMLHAGATVRLLKEGLFGEQTLELSAGDPEAAVLADGDVIGYAAEASLEQLLLDLKPTVSHANTLLAELAELAAWLNDPDSDVRVVLAEMRHISRDLKTVDVAQTVQKLAAAAARVEAMVKALNEQQAAEHLAASLAQTTQILAQMQPLAQSLGEQGGDTIAHANALIAQLGVLSRNLNVIAADLAELTPELPGLVQESRQTIAQMHGMLEGLRGSWLFKDDAAAGREETALAPPPLALQP